MVYYLWSNGFIVSELIRKGTNYMTYFARHEGEDARSFFHFSTYSETTSIPYEHKNWFGKDSNQTLNPIPREGKRKRLLWFIYFLELSQLF
jgi:hypothetical protein